MLLLNCGMRTMDKYEWILFIAGAIAASALIITTFTLVKDDIDYKNKYKQCDHMWNVKESGAYVEVTKITTDKGLCCADIGMTNLQNNLAIENKCMWVKWDG